MKISIAHRVQQGFSMIEVLVTIVILTIGLLGLAGMQSRLQLSEMEAYQRAQALILLEDMASRISANRSPAALDGYIADTVTPLGANRDCDAIGLETRQKVDATEWCHSLQGAGETLGTSKVGTLVGGRGCVQRLANGDYMVTVAWQGSGPISAPPASVACGVGLYNTAGTPCVNDLCRRTLTTVVRIAELT
jgi:type IV pilus assembly protein PilV